MSSSSPETGTQKRWLVLSGLTAVLIGVFVLVPLFQPARVMTDSSFYSPPNRLKAVAFALYLYHDNWGSFPPIQSKTKNEQIAVSWRWAIRSELDVHQTANDLTIDKQPPAPRPIRSDRGSSTDVLALTRNGQWNIEFDETAVRANRTRVLCVGGSPLLEVPWTHPIDFDLDQRGFTLEPTEWLLLEDGSVVRRSEAEITMPAQETTSRSP